MLPTQEKQKESNLERVTSTHGWNNYSNYKLYNQMPLDYFYNTAVKSGLDTGKDITLIMPYIQKAKAILEVGAGYGRVVNHLIQKGYKGELVAVERSDKFYPWLCSQYQERVEIIQGDVKQLVLNKRFDVILWMWSGISEFSKFEQLPMIEKLISLLNQGGFFIFDTVSPEEKTLNSINVAEQEHIIKTEYGTDYCYIPTDKEINNYADNLGLKIVECIKYQPIINRNRYLYILQA